ncbi:hypothetical protein [Nocardia sp. NPDC051832]|uniref:hypothetical protein n=1 Tax=Nocardia sp. NPDC051832 TaxID=3155673 RepID=UPI003434BBE3
MVTELVVVAIVVTLLTSAAIAMNWDPRRDRRDRRGRSTDSISEAAMPRDGGWPRRTRR